MRLFNSLYRYLCILKLMFISYLVVIVYLLPNSFLVLIFNELKHFVLIH